MSLKIWYLVQKDVAESIGNKQVLLPMIILPLVICAIMPALIIIIGLQGSVSLIQGAEMIKQSLHLYAFPADFAAPGEQLLYVMLNFILLPFFLIIPLMVSVTIAANSIAGEKERLTLETLLYTPLDNRELVLGKLLSAFVPAMAISFASFLLYFGIANGLFLALRGAWLVSSPTWIPAMLLLNPAIALLGLASALLVGMKAKTQMEAQQTAALVVLPVILLVAAQAGGLVVLSPLAVVAAALVFFALDWVLIVRVIPRFDRDRIIEIV